ncbi:MAG: hypothetical protein AAGA80_00965 [Cyanobacteria bacterium P01_F01_bin.143]
MSRRDEIVPIILERLKQLENFDQVTYWQATPSQYEQNHLNLNDGIEKYQPKNNKYDAQLELMIEAVVIETAQKSAADLGNLALKDLITAVNSLTLSGAIFQLKQSNKFVETQGKTACLVELVIQVLYKFDR